MRSADSADEARRADIEIERRLREVGFDLGSAISQQFADTLYALGVGTLVKLHGQDRLLAECRSRGLLDQRPPPASWNTEAKKIVIAAVEMAVIKFITRRIRSWDPLKGALSTYFVHSCFFEFKDHYLSFCSEQARRRNECDLDNVVSLIDRRHARGSVEGQVLQEQVVQDAMHLVGDEQLAQMVELLCNGFTHREVADALGISGTTVRRRIREIRERLQRDGSWRTGEGR